jgi:hypothetical protein
MFQKLLPYLITVFISIVGLLVITFPFSSGEKAYYVNDNQYINIKDSVDKGYTPYLKSILQQKQYSLAFEEKKEFRSIHKTSIDSLSSASLDAKLSKNHIALEKVKVLQNELTELISRKEFEIDDKYSISQLGEGEFKALYIEIQQNTSLIDYVVAVANEQINYNEKIDITADNITVKKVNQQNKSPFLLSGLFILSCACFMYFYQTGKIQLENKKTRMLIQGALVILSLTMVSKIYLTFSDRISFDKTLDTRSAVVKDKMLIIRTAELNYYEAKNKYCNNWKELIRFYKEDSIKIVKYLVNKDDTAAVNLRIKAGLPLEKAEMVPALVKAFPDLKIDLENLPFVPFSDNPFDLNAGVVDKNGRNIHVFEVRTTKLDFVKKLENLPDNFDRGKSLIIGSMNEPTTESNW